MINPIIKYTKSSNVNIAYQVFGYGPVDLVYIPGWISNIDWMWECPELVSFFKELGKIARVILFDKRGTGLSDRTVEFATLEERMEDIKQVMDAVGSKKAVLFGHSEGGSVSALFSAMYPDRVISLITFGVFAKRKYAKDYPWAPTANEREKLYKRIENNWCNGEMHLENLAPSKASDAEFMNWLASYFRSGASPKTALKLTKMNTEVNIIGILKYIRVPTLLMQRTDDIDVKIEEGKFIAKHVYNAKFVEFNGADHLFWVGNTKEILDQMKNFIDSAKQTKKTTKKLCAILYGQLINCTKKSIENNKFICKLITEYGGKIIQAKSEKHFTAHFQSPGKATACGIILNEALLEKSHIVSFGISMKEVTYDNLILNTEHDNCLLKSLQSQLEKSRVLVTPIVKNLLTGAALDFSPVSALLDVDSLDICKLYKVTQKNTASQTSQLNEPLFISEYNSFIENVFNIIDTHIEDDTFSIKILSKKMSMSERQLQRKIKEITGKSPNQLITSIRLKRAKDVLLTNIYTVAEIAFRFGFTSPSYFSKCFKKEFGQQPTALLLKAS